MTSSGDLRNAYIILVAEPKIVDVSIKKLIQSVTGSCEYSNVLLLFIKIKTFADQVIDFQLLVKKVICCVSFAYMHAKCKVHNIL
jgi:hypothetical protein